MPTSPTLLRPHETPAVPANLILLSDGAQPLPDGWTTPAPTVAGSYLAAGASRGHGGSASHGHAAVAAHAHVDSGGHAHRWRLGAGPTVVEQIAKGDEGAVFGAPHEHTSSVDCEGPTGAAAAAATTELEAAANELPHREVRLVKNTAGARSCDGLLGLSVSDAPLVGWRGIGEVGGPDADFAGRFLKLVDAEPSPTPAGAAEHAHAVAAHHAAHGTYPHDHGPSADVAVPFDAADPADVTTDSGGAGGNWRVQAAAHDHLLTVPAGSVAGASPAVSDTTGSSEPLTTADTLDRLVVALRKAAAGARPRAGLVALWDSADGPPPAGWSALPIAAENNAPYVQVRSAAEALGETSRAAGPNDFAASHAHALASHGHATTAVGGQSPADVSVPGSDAAETLPDWSGWPITLDDAATATIDAAETAWTTTPTADAHLPPFERFVLIEKQ